MFFDLTSMVLLIIDRQNVFDLTPMVSIIIDQYNIFDWISMVFLTDYSPASVFVMVCHYSSCRGDVKMVCSNILHIYNISNAKGILKTQILIGIDIGQLSSMNSFKQHDCVTHYWFTDWLLTPDQVHRAFNTWCKQGRL